MAMFHIPSESAVLHARGPMQMSYDSGWNFAPSSNEPDDDDDDGTLPTKKASATTKKAALLPSEVQSNHEEAGAPSTKLNKQQLKAATKVATKAGSEKKRTQVEQQQVDMDNTGPSRQSTLPFGHVKKLADTWQVPDMDSVESAFGINIEQTFEMEVDVDNGGGGSTTAPPAGKRRRADTASPQKSPAANARRPNKAPRTTQASASGRTSPTPGPSTRSMSRKGKEKATEIAPAAKQPVTKKGRGKKANAIVPV
ncbi:hypothetical protein VTO73DRAFT_7540 [Trametes versicolor]